LNPVYDPESVHAYFSATPSASHWGRIGTQRRAGVAAPLFTLYSRRSIGIGEIPDLRLLIDWCRACGLSLIQLLPLNDVGFTFCPYDAQSMLAMDPMYLSLAELREVEPRRFAERADELRRRYPAGRGLVDYGIKQAKIELLQAIFSTRDWQDSSRFQEFRLSHALWLHDYALFKTLKIRHQQKGWEEWEGDFRAKSAAALRAFAEENSNAILFQEWLQWQLAEQLQAVKAYARKQGVLLMGDIPFLVSRDSADVWANQNFFKLDRASGAPPDALLARGQRWGMPPYAWETIARHQYAYLVNKLKYAQNFFDLYRIDHFVGIFRLWTIPLSEPESSGGINGAFDPAEENQWEEHGRRLLEVMLRSTSMLPCAEDLGVIPDCSFKILREYGVVGMDIQRWSKDWKGSKDFTPAEQYRLNALATISTHDMSSLRAWWTFEAGTVDEVLFERQCAKNALDAGALKPALFDPARSHHGRLAWKTEIVSEDVLLGLLGRGRDAVHEILAAYAGSYGEKAKFWKFIGLPGEVEEDFNSRFAEAALKAVCRTACVFTVQLIQDWLAGQEAFQRLDPWNYRINFPGSMRKTNWSLVLPLSLEELLGLPDQDRLKGLLQETQRI